MKSKPFYVNFNLGLNTKDSPKFIKDGECSICQDVDFDKEGSIFSRKFKRVRQNFGSNPKTIFPYGSLITHLKNGDIYNGTRKIASGYGSLPFNLVEYNSILYGVNGLKNFRYNGVEFYNIGNVYPLVAPIAADAAVAGNPNGSYYYKYTYVDKYGKESSASEVSGEVTVDTNKITVNIVPSTDPKINYIYLYRIGGSLTDYYYVDRILNQVALDGLGGLTYSDTDDQGGIYQNVYADENFAYVAAGALGILTYTYSSGGTLTYVDADATGITNAYGIYSDGNFIYVSDYDAGIYSYAVDVNGNLTQIDSDTTVTGARHIWCDDKYIYLAGGTNNIIYTYSVDGSGNLTRVSTYTSPSGYTFYDIWSDGEFMYAGCNFGVASFSVDESGELRLISFTYIEDSGDNVVKIIGDGNFIYGAISNSTATDSGIISLKANEFGHLSVVETLRNDSGNEVGLGVWTDGNYIYLGQSDDGIKVFSADNSGNLTLIDSDDQGDDYFGVFGYNNLVFTCRSATGLSTYTISTYAYTDNIADSNLTTLFDADVNDKIPNGTTFMVEHYERMISAKTTYYKNSILYSKPYEPEYWGLNLNQQYLLGAGEDECTGLLSWGRYIVYAKKHQIYIMEGTDPATWNKRRSDSVKGNVTPYAIAFWKFPIICSYDGLHIFDGNLSNKFSQRVDPWFELRKDYLSNAVGIVFKDKYYFSISDQTLVFDLLFNKFYVYDFEISSFGYDYRNDILYAGVGNDLVSLYESENTDEESVDFQIKSKAYSMSPDDVIGKEGEINEYAMQINTQGDSVTFNIYVDGYLQDTKTLNTKTMTNIRGTFLSNLRGAYAEFELTYSGTNRIQIDGPIVINGMKNA